MIEVHNLTFGYASGEEKQILKGVDFVAQTGKLTAVIGTNGAGKSTLLKAIMGILKGNGDIRLNGKPAAAYTSREFSSTVSYLSQDNDCRINLSVFEVVMLGRMGSLSFRVKEEDLRATEEVLQRLNMQELASRSITALSGGQRQLVFIAQTLVKEPTILLLDEPTSALDLHKQFKLLTLLKRLTQENQFTTLVTLHHLDLAAKFADEIIILQKGEVYAQGQAREIFTEAMMEEVYRVKTKIYVDERDVPHVIPLEAIP
ncbi:ABC transporter ATP-binding protein [Selenomonas sp. TAMA-11512]|uniref:ABC transporter ATP-binding protein n=1 Tax=Selenomonas sp. TAMA-11512 TaxID=3095337 RepID=UPI0030908716|nr:ABC transporter ATP-binding protein [Selenomonas sp. TAMA-11512]